jgi:large subunit ribosomal protein L21
VKAGSGLPAEGGDPLKGKEKPRAPPGEFAFSPGIYYNFLAMYAIIETGGKQYWVVPGDLVKVEKIEAEAGSEIVLKALWASSETQESGAQAPSGQSAKVTAEVVRQFKDRKIIVFKKRPKKNYVRRMGHRQRLTEIRIKEIQFN